MVLAKNEMSFGVVLTSRPGLPAGGTVSRAMLRQWQVGETAPRFARVSLLAELLVGEANENSIIFLPVVPASLRSALSFLAFSSAGAPRRASVYGIDLVLVV